MSDLIRISRKVSETNRPIKQTCFCDNGPWYSNESNPL